MCSHSLGSSNVGVCRIFLNQLSDRREEHELVYFHFKKWGPGACGYHASAAMMRIQQRPLESRGTRSFRAHFPAMSMIHGPGYNAVNGKPTCLDERAQNGLLREEFGFGGMIVSE